jgi:uncharacterized protein
MIVNRDKYLQELVSSRHNGLVKIITGMRRCGKSFLLFRLFKRFLEDDGVMPDHIIEMAFDDYAFKEFRNPDKFYKYVKEKIADDQPYYILLDEVQMLGEFEDVLNGLLHIPNADVYVTGSNARFLSKDIITEFLIQFLPHASMAYLMMKLFSTLCLTNSLAANSGTFSIHFWSWKPRMEKRIPLR